MSEIKNIADIPLLKLADLRRECRLLGISIAGNKSELCQKLTQYFLDKGMPNISPESNVSSLSNATLDLPKPSVAYQMQKINMYTSSVGQNTAPLNNHYSKNNAQHLSAPDSYYISNNEVSSTLMASQDKSNLPTSHHKLLIDDDLSEEKLLDSSNEDSPDNPDIQNLNGAGDSASQPHLIKLIGISNISGAKRSILREQKFQNLATDSHNPKASHPKHMDEKMLTRAKRFGLPVKTLATDSVKEPAKTNLGSDVKKLRAERFGSSAPDDASEKIKKSNRALRFGLQ